MISIDSGVIAQAMNDESIVSHLLHTDAQGNLKIKKQSFLSMYGLSLLRFFLRRPSWQILRELPQYAKKKVIIFTVLP